PDSSSGSFTSAQSRSAAYTPGHTARVAAVRAALRVAYPTLAVAGAGYDGVGIPVCVRSGETAAEEIITALEGSAA
ncbi:hypothetical protein ABZS65_30485, partial [Micromonospora sp. NPDC005313]